jgi:hypothetical protein
MVFTERVTGITQDTILPKVVDTILGGNFITFRFLSQAAKWSGEKVKRPIKVSKSTLGGSFSGLDTHSTATSETRVTMYYDPRGYEMPIAIPGLEKAVNKTEAQVIDLVRVEVESAQEDALDDLGTMLYADGTGNSNKDFLGLDALDDDNTSVVTIGGLSRNTYPTLKSTRTASGGTLDLDKLATLVSTVSAGSGMRNRPTVFVSSETEWDFYESLLSPVVMANYQAFGLPQVTMTSKGPIREAELKGAAGYSSLTYRGIPWIADEKSPAGTLWALNENYLQWYGLQDADLEQISFDQGEVIEGVYSEVPSKNIGFQWTGFMRPINQYGEVAHMYLLGNFLTWNPKRLGRLTGIEGV